MDELTAFERHLADELGRMAGPGRRIDAVSMARSVARSSGSTRMSPPLRSAAQIVIGAIIVVAIGGSLVLTLLRQQPAEVSAPAATASASLDIAPSAIPTADPTPIPPREAQTFVTSDLLEGVDLATEGVERGVLRVANDGIQDLSWPADRRPWERRLLPGTGGALLLRQGFDTYRLGATWTGWGDGIDPVPLPGDRVSYVGLDGDALVRGSLGGETSIIHSPVDAFAVGLDGTIWTATKRNGVAECGIPRGSCGTLIRTVDREGGEVIRRTGPSRERMRRLAERGGAIDEARRSGVTIDGIWATNRGVWLDEEWGDGRDTLTRVDADRLEVVESPVAGSDGPMWMLSDMGTDGSFWVKLARPDDRLARFDGTDWTLYDESDGVPPWSGDVRMEGDGGFLEVAQDGSAWMAAVGSRLRSGSRCDGVHRFDGRTWTRFLTGHCVYSMAFGADGSVWVLAVDHGLEAPPFPGLELFVIRPEVALART